MDKERWWASQRHTVTSVQEISWHFDPNHHISRTEIQKPALQDNSVAVCFRTEGTRFIENGTGELGCLTEDDWRHVCDSSTDGTWLTMVWLIFWLYDEHSAETTFQILNVDLSLTWTYQKECDCSSPTIQGIGNEPQLPASNQKDKQTLYSTLWHLNWNVGTSGILNVFLTSDIFIVMYLLEKNHHTNWRIYIIWPTHSFISIFIRSLIFLLFEPGSYISI